MDVVKLVGTRSSTFKNKDGELVTFYQWHTQRQADSKRGEAGTIVEVVKCSADAFAASPEIGSEITVLYDKYGRAIDFLSV